MSDTNGFSALLDHTGRPWRGSDDSPASFDPGAAIPQVLTFAGLIRGSANTYFRLRFDEAMRNSRENAVAMLLDEHLHACMDEYIDSISSLKWHIEVDNPKDGRQKAVADGLTTAIKATPFFRRLCRQLLWARWYGRYGVQVERAWTTMHMPMPGPDFLGGDPTPVPTRVPVIVTHTPINGDKIGWTFDHVPLIQVNAGYATQWERMGAKVIYDNIGASVELREPRFRDRFVIHCADGFDADFYDPQAADAIHGVGVRSWLYWAWWTRNEYVSTVVDALERFGLGFIAILYQAGDAAAEKAAENVAKTYSRRAVLTIPVSGGQARNLVGGVQVVEAPTAGMEIMLRLQQACDERTNRFIVGQTLSSDHKGSGGLGGSGAAEFQADTKFQKVSGGAEDLGETLTGSALRPGLVSVLLRHVYPWADFPARFRFNVPDPEKKEKVEGAKILVELGGEVVEEEVRELLGLATPQEGDDTLGGKEQLAAQQQADAAGAFGGKGGPSGEGGEEEKPNSEDLEEEPLHFFASDVPERYAAHDVSGESRDESGKWTGGTAARREGLKAAHHKAKQVVHEHATSGEPLETALAAAYWDHPAVQKVFDAVTKIYEPTYDVPHVSSPLLAPSVFPKDANDRRDEFKKLSKLTDKALQSYAVADLSDDSRSEADRGKTMHALRQVKVFAQRGLRLVEGVRQAQASLRSPPNGAPPAAKEQPDFFRRDDAPELYATHDVSDQKRGEDGRWTAATSAMQEAHPHPGPTPATRPGTFSPAAHKADPTLAHDLARHEEHSAAYGRHYTAHAMHRMLSEPPPRPVPLSAPDDTPAKKASRAKRAIEAASNAMQDVTTLGRAFANHHTPVAASHPEGQEALTAARAEARRRLENAVQVARQHIATLPPGVREKAESRLARETHGETQPDHHGRDELPVPYAAHDVSGEKRDEGGKWTTGGGTQSHEQEWSPANPAGVTTHKSRAELEAMAPEHRRAYLKKRSEDLAELTQRIRASLKPGQVEAVQAALRSLGAHFEGGKSVNATGLLGAMRQQGIDTGSTGLKGHKLIDKLAFLGELAVVDRGKNFLGQKQKEYMLPPPTPKQVEARRVAAEKEADANVDANVEARLHRWREFRKAQGLPVTFGSEDLPEFYAADRRDHPEFYADPGEGHWVTMGAEKGEDGESHGGSRVFIGKDGKITAGAPDLVGKHVGELLREHGAKKEEAKKSEEKQNPPSTGVDKPTSSGDNTSGVANPVGTGKKPEGGTMTRKTSEIIKDYNNLQASARNMKPEEAQSKAKVLHDEMAAVLPPLSPAAAATRTLLLRSIGQHVHQLDRDALNQRSAAEYSPHMTQKAEGTEKEAEMLRRQMDAMASVTDEAWWTRNDAKIRSSTLTAAREYGKGSYLK